MAETASRAAASSSAVGGRRTYRMGMVAPEGAGPARSKVCTSSPRLSATASFRGHSPTVKIPFRDMGGKAYPIPPPHATSCSGRRRSPRGGSAQASSFRNTPRWASSPDSMIARPARSRLARAPSHGVPGWHQNRYLNTRAPGRQRTRGRDTPRRSTGRISPGPLPRAGRGRSGYRRERSESWRCRPARDSHIGTSSERACPVPTHIVYVNNGAVTAREQRCASCRFLQSKAATAPDPVPCDAVTEVVFGPAVSFQPT